MLTAARSFLPSSHCVFSQAELLVAADSSAAAFAATDAARASVTAWSSSSSSSSSGQPAAEEIVRLRARLQSTQVPPTGII